MTNELSTPTKISCICGKKYERINQMIVCPGCGDYHINKTIKEVDLPLAAQRFMLTEKNPVRGKDKIRRQSKHHFRAGQLPIELFSPA